MIYYLEAALFNGAPKIGSKDCSQEVTYAGYARVPFVSDGSTNMHGIQFPKSKQDEPVHATHVVVIDSKGVIVGSSTL